MRIPNIFKSRTIAATIIAGALGLGIGVALAAQPDMEGALHALQAAQGHLEHVTQNKGGHAAAARKLVAEAISEVQAGIEVGHEKGE
jgi:uncharacterized protein HemX